MDRNIPYILVQTEAYMWVGGTCQPLGETRWILAIILLKMAPCLLGMPNYPPTQDHHTISMEWPSHTHTHSIKSQFSLCVCVCFHWIVTTMKQYIVEEKNVISWIVQTQEGSGGGGRRGGRRGEGSSSSTKCFSFSMIWVCCCGFTMEGDCCEFRNTRIGFTHGTVSQCHSCSEWRKQNRWCHSVHYQGK